MCLRNWNNNATLHGMVVGFMIGIGLSGLIYVVVSYMGALP